MKMKNKTLVSNYGNGIAIGLHGTREFVEGEFTRFFNCGAVSAHYAGKRDENGEPNDDKGTSVCGQLHEVGDTEGTVFSYFLSTSEKMVEALTLAHFLRMTSSGESKLFKGLPAEFRTATVAAAEFEFHGYTREEFMSRFPTYPVNEVYGTGKPRAERD
jgi:hypothetical protein